MSNFYISIGKSSLITYEDEIDAGAIPGMSAIRARINVTSDEEGDFYGLTETTGVVSSSDFYIPSE